MRTLEYGLLIYLASCVGVLSGCIPSQDYNVTVANISGESVKDVVVSSKEGRSFNFGSLGDSNGFSHMNANQVFGASPPTRLTVVFTKEHSGETPVRKDISVKLEEPERTIRIVIDSEFNAKQVSETAFRAIEERLH